ncbi:cupin domain-containing protein [Paraburkholderia sp. DHOC27]|uniref:cupin domain-containing protein n=1 Tax=Paraburkholderia sp. DHOC27 TaxID=2303330 RepID=UPI0015F321C4|nr:cupin domain-containing protein [Paraburkholderia sp. DHOC27]
MFVLNTDAPEYNFAGTRVRLLMSGQQTGETFCMMEMFSPPGKGTPLHAHSREEETITMLEGTLDVLIEGETVKLHAGDTLLVPRNVPHRLANTGEVLSRYLVVCTPAGFDGFVGDCADAQTGPITATPPRPEDIARMREAAPRFGISLMPMPQPS